MGVDVTTAIVIARPVDVVAAFAQDPSNAPQWYQNIETIVWESEPVVAVGSKAAFVAHFLGREMRYTYTIESYEPGRTLAMKATDGPFPMETIYTFEPQGSDATRMTLRNRGEPSGFSLLVAPFMSMAMRRANEKDLRCLKSLLESGTV